ncbi:PT domain-containing protein [Helicobacter pylori]|nr:PT domain-containing protein [Helicobacter pylori]
MKQPSNQATKQPSNQATKQPSNQATKQPSNQATLSCFYNYFYHFYKRSLKNPLLFIIPPFINPCINPFIPSLINPCHNIFKPFDSISPIFKPVGLTELNSIQGEDDGSVRRFESA